MNEQQEMGTISSDKGSADSHVQLANAQTAVEQATPQTQLKHQSAEAAEQSVSQTQSRDGSMKTSQVSEPVPKQTNKPEEVC